MDYKRIGLITKLHEVLGIIIHIWVAPDRGVGVFVEIVCCGVGVVRNNCYCTFSLDDTQKLLSHSHVHPTSPLITDFQWEAGEIANIRLVRVLEDKVLLFSSVPHATCLNDRKWIFKK